MLPHNPISAVEEMRIGNTFTQATERTMQLVTARNLAKNSGNEAEVIRLNKEIEELSDYSSKLLNAIQDMTKLRSSGILNSRFFV